MKTITIELTTMEISRDNYSALGIVFHNFEGMSKYKLYVVEELDVNRLYTIVHNIISMLENKGCLIYNLSPKQIEYGRTIIDSTGICRENILYIKYVFEIRLKDELSIIG